MNGRLIQQMPLEELLDDLVTNARDLGQLELSERYGMRIAKIYIEDRMEGDQEKIAKIKREIKRRFGVFCS